MCFAWNWWGISLVEAFPANEFHEISETGELYGMSQLLTIIANEETSVRKRSCLKRCVECRNLNLTYMLDYLLYKQTFIWVSTSLSSFLVQLQNISFHRLRIFWHFLVPIKRTWKFKRLLLKTVFSKLSFIVSQKRLDQMTWSL